MMEYQCYACEEPMEHMDWTGLCDECRAEFDDWDRPTESALLIFIDQKQKEVKTHGR